MKTAIILSDGIKQIVFTPENEQEKQALQMFSVDDNIEMAIKAGTFGDKRFKPFTASINMCQGGFLRVFDDAHSIIFVLSPKNKSDDRPS